MLRFLAVFFSFPICFNSNSQFQILDKETNEGLPFAHILQLSKNKKELTNANGEFKLDSLTLIDSLLISCIGYEQQVIIGERLMNDKTIALVPKSKNIDEVKVTVKRGKYLTKKIGIVKKPKTLFFDYNITGKNGTEQAVWIPNPYSTPGYLKNVNIFITENGFPDAYFRIHIYECQLEKKPDKELTQSNIITSGTFGNEWITVNLTQERIFISENGCFIGIEWFDSPLSKNYSDTLTYGNSNDHKHTRIHSGNGVVLGSRNESYRNAKNKVWHKNEKEEWISWTIADESKFNIPDTATSGNIRILNEDNLYFQIPCINIEISLKKEKVISHYYDAPKRKLNKIEKIQPNDFNYPQSNPKELFESLIKAFNNDEIIYILRYLCVYKENELKEIIEQLEENQEKYNKLLSPEECEKIVAELEEMRNNLTEKSLEKISNGHYKLKIGKLTYNLVVDHGKWKINPYTYRVIAHRP